jgi:FkbM family methyltransferase
MTTWRSRLLQMTQRLGLYAVQLAPGVWMLQRPGGPQQRLAVEELDEDTFVVQTGRRRRRAVEQIGPKALRTHVVSDRRAARANARKFQRFLGAYAGEQHISSVLRALQANCVLDVGANVGQYAKRLRKAGYRGRIVSFEPLPALAAELRKAADKDPDWHVMECALGDADTTTTINVVPGTMSSLLPSSEFGKSWSNRLQDMRPQEVVVRRLDSVFDEVVEGMESPRVYLKLDTQGYDLQAFAGAGDRVQQIIGMQSEVACVPIYDGMPRLPEQISVYEGAGFEISGMFPVTIDRKTLRVIEFDAVLVRPHAVTPEE